MIIDLLQPEGSASLTRACESGNETRSPQCESGDGETHRPARASSVRRVVPTALAAVALAAATSASAASWNGAGSDALWSNSTNWNGGALPSSSESADFSGSSPFAVDVDISAQAAVLNINSATPYTFNNTGGSLALSSGNIEILTGSHSIHCPVSLGTNGVWNVPGGEQLDVAGIVSGAHSLTLAGGGTLVLSASNTYTGGTVINGATVAIADDFNLGASSGAVLFQGTAPTLRISAGISEPNFSRNLVCAPGVTGSIEVQTNTLSILTGETTGAWVKTGDGLLALSFNTNYLTGDLVVSNGLLWIGGVVTPDSGTPQILVQSGGVLSGRGPVTNVPVTIAAGGTIAPGELEAPETFTVYGSVTNRGTYLCKVEGSSADKIVATGNLDLTGSTLAINDQGATTNAPYIIASYGTLTGIFATISNLPAGLVLDYNYGGGNFIALVSSELAAPMLHWPLDEGTGTNTLEAISGQTNVASLVGPVAWTGGLALGSADAVSVGIDSPNPSYVEAGTLTTNGTYVPGSDAGYRVLQNNWSVTAWVRLPSPQGTGSDRVIASSDTGGAQTWWLFFVWDTSVQENLGFDFSSDRVTSGLSVPLDQPVFVAIVADSSGAAVGGTTNKHRFYMWDGNSWQTSSGSQFINLRLQGLELGSFNNGTRQFDGVIDDVRIYDQTLTQANLDALAVQPPVLTVTPVGAGQLQMSWSPDLPGYVLQETPGLAPAAWTNSPSGHTNPIVVPADVPAKFYRLFKP